MGRLEANSPPFVKCRRTRLPIGHWPALLLCGPGLMAFWLTRAFHAALRGDSSNWQQTPRYACPIDAQGSDQILLWFLNIIKFKSLMGKQRFHKSSNMGIICKQLPNGDRVSCCPWGMTVLILKMVRKRVWN